MIVIGASLGGLRALGLILSGLPDKFSVPIAVVLHRSKDTPDLLASVLASRTALRVREVLDKDRMEGGTVYLAPPDYHLLVDREGFGLSIDPPVNFARPSIDVLFESAADLFGAECIGVILTGSSADGASGAAAIFAQRGTVIVQEPNSAESPILPASALAQVPQARIVPLAQIAPLLVQLSAARLKL